MLYNPNKPIQQPSLAGFIAWLETKDPNGCYDWRSCKECACSQYAASLGVYNWDRYVNEEPWIMLNHLASNGAPWPARVQPWGYIAPDECGWTFGALLQQARAMLSGS
jgi:hypothetical protein